jgi:hypothetical protein
LREEEEGKREKNLFKDQFQYCQPWGAIFLSAITQCIDWMAHFA